jgi:hypothetical protein
VVAETHASLSSSLTANLSFNLIRHLHRHCLNYPVIDRYIDHVYGVFSV